MIIQLTNQNNWIICVILLVMSTTLQAIDTPTAEATEATTVEEASNTVLEANQSKSISLQFDEIPFFEIAGVVEEQSDIKIDIVPDLENELITANIKSNNWEAVLPRLLKGYNRVGFISPEGKTTRVLVTGLNGNGKDPYSFSGNLFDYSETNSLSDIPDQLKNMPTGSVIKINFNKSILKNMSPGESVSVILPIGKFNIINENVIIENQESFTWMGYLENVSPKQKVVLNFAEKSSFGRINTLEGAFRVETIEGIDWLVKVDKAGIPSDSDNDDFKSDDLSASEIEEFENIEEIDQEKVTDYR